MIGTKEERNAQSLASIAKSLEILNHNLSDYYNTLETISKSLESIASAIGYDEDGGYYLKVGKI
jgi:hypothetical protein